MSIKLKQSRSRNHSLTGINTAAKNKVVEKPSRFTLEAVTAPSKDCCAVVFLRGMRNFTRQHRTMRVLEVAKCFRLWCDHARSASMGNQSQMNRRKLMEDEKEEVISGSDKWRAQQYLCLFSENELLRDQLEALQRLSTHNEKDLKEKGCRAILLSFFHSKARVNLRRMFDRWAHVTHDTNKISALSHQKLQLEVGMQHVHSEREIIKQGEAANFKLRGTLLCTLFFFTWKAKVSEAVLAEERNRHASERMLIRKELRKLKEVVMYANAHEACLLQTAAKNGEDIMGSLYTIKNNLTNVVHDEDIKHIYTESLASAVSSPVVHPKQHTANVGSPPHHTGRHGSNTPPTHPHHHTPSRHGSGTPPVHAAPPPHTHTTSHHTSTPPHTQPSSSVESNRSRTKSFRERSSSKA